ncbi:hypothetical protein GCM10010365_38540 [Streptomyces poonensis]|uniref:Uncharacterized protein n=1 Tax=Streptomyces poonensis TaxID=68255 RepID=A0A918PLM7_9ACTN|nr:hypothetical protein GCM10010365_38540 [Streptomyces poonensis]GLJ91457.1 hypothetical protein GCM10017589_40640 [Streptomyces poonensis]
MAWTIRRNFSGMRLDEAECRSQDVHRHPDFVRGSLQKAQIGDTTGPLQTRDRRCRAAESAAEIGLPPPAPASAQLDQASWVALRHE